MKRILVVDDDPAVAQMLKLLLERDGHQACAVTSAGDALGELHKGEFDLVVSEVSIKPPMDGLALAEYVQLNTPSTRFILATGASSPFERFSRAPGVDAVVDKPYRLAELRRVIEAPRRRGRISPLRIGQSARRRALR